MKIKWLCSIILITSLFLSNSAFCYDDQYDTYVFFGNGVLNDVQSTASSARMLKHKLRQHVDGTNLEGRIRVASSHNPTIGAIGDLLEAHKQNLQTSWIQFWLILSGLNPMPDYFQQKLIDITNSVKDDIVQGNVPELQYHIDTYNNLLSDCKKVVVVPHSQGNLFANIAYSKIDEDAKDSFGIVAVATPDSYVAGDGPYTTLDEDYIIGAIPFAMDSNLDNFFGPINTNEITGHYFGRSYMLEGYPAETKILDDIVATIEDFKNPCPNELVLVSAAPGTDINSTTGRSEADWKAFLWDVGKGKYAENIPKSEAPWDFVSFPCDLADLDYWKSLPTISATGNPLYEREMHNTYRAPIQNSNEPACGSNSTGSKSSYARGPNGEVPIYNTCESTYSFYHTGDPLYKIEDSTRTIDNNGHKSSYRYWQKNTHQSVGILTTENYFETAHRDNQPGNSFSESTGTGTITRQGPFGDKITMPIGKYTYYGGGESTATVSSLKSGGPSGTNYMTGNYYSYPSGWTQSGGRLRGTYGNNVVAQILVIEMGVTTVDENSELTDWDHQHEIYGAINYVDDEEETPYFDLTESQLDSAFSAACKGLADGRMAVQEFDGVYFNITTYEDQN
ncbi:MAG: hypothetical protein GY729_14665 [Desulfobacteraceae bacterium]|nr:hypothetical protein [Desulfobacteraceae bacterium]